MGSSSLLTQNQRFTLVRKTLFSSRMDFNVLKLLISIARQEKKVVIFMYCVCMSKEYIWRSHLG